MEVCPFAPFPDRREISQSIIGEECHLESFKISEIRKFFNDKEMKQNDKKCHSFNCERQKKGFVGH